MKKLLLLVLALGVAVASAYGAGTIANGALLLTAGGEPVDNDTVVTARARSMSVIIGPVTGASSPLVTVTAYLSNGDTRVYTFDSSTSAIAPPYQFDIYRFGTRTDSIDVTRANDTVNVLLIPYGSRLQ